MKNPSQKPTLSFFTLLLGFKRFSADLLGILLIFIGVISLLGLFRISPGILIDFWTSNLEKGFGWGAYLLAAFLIYVGILILFRRIEKFPHLNLQRLVAIEALIFSIMALMAIFSGFSLENAEIGAYGGVIGWGLAKLIDKILPLPVSTIILFILSFFLILDGTGILNFFLKKVIPQWLDGHSVQPEADFDNKVKVENGNSQILKSDTDQVLPLKNLGIPQKAFKFSDGQLPPLNILLSMEKINVNKDYVHAQAVKIEKTLADLNVPIKVIGYRIGPTIIQFAVEPGYYEKVNEFGELVRKRVKMAQISACRDDLTLALAVERLRIETPIPNHSYVGVEVPNQFSSIVRIKPILESEAFKDLKSSLGLALGLDVSNNPIVADLVRMPHLLIGGTTGSGKSVCIVSAITCLLINNTPSNLHMIMLDPKKVELVRFEGIPHLLGHVETEPLRMTAALRWAVAEMERRFKLLEQINARELDSYNEKAQKRGLETLPRIVILIDELADLIMAAPDQTAGSIQRLTQMARATGIHLVVSTQRPSTNIVSGLIKSNFPARIAFLTASAVDSRVIIDSNGAETLLGKGDMLFLNPEMSGLLRGQSPLVDDKEIDGLVNYWKENIPSDQPPAPWEGFELQETEVVDDLLQRAVQIIRQENKASTSLLQRRLRIGYPRAARLIDELEEKGYIGPAETGGKDREVFLSSE